MILQRATPDDYASIIAFYDDVIERTPSVAEYARWQKGKHPTADGIKAYIEEGSMDLYVAVIHILGVRPDKQGAGIGSRMVLEAIDLAKSKGKKDVRLDALASNTPAHKIYERLGFEYKGKQRLYAENTGWTDFYFFELTRSLID